MTVQMSPKLTKQFEDHLNEKENNRIIFSAPFGVGKTTFLKDFQKKCPKYEFFHLFPVNYSVGTNEDIFEYLKYDILYSLINNGVTFEATDFQYLKAIEKYLKSNAHKVAALPILMIPKVGKDLYSLFEKLDKIKDEILKIGEELTLDEGKQAYQFISEIDKKTGSIYEIDIYTRLIENKLSILKNDNGKKNILIIDDLDRIDPHHIFRLLNVFSAHFDLETSCNKFGFDQIIFVCDFNNIKKIYSNFYGHDVDFNGYIDKFYSKSIYKFFNYETLSEHLTIQLQSHKNSVIKFTEKDISFLSFILHPLIQNGKLNFREIIKINKIELIHKYTYNYSDRTDKFLQCKLLKIAGLLTNIFGSAESLLQVLFEVHEMQTNSFEKLFIDNDDNMEFWYTQYIIPVQYYNTHNWNTNKDLSANVGSIHFNLELKYDIVHENPYYYTEIKPNNNQTPYKFMREHFWRDLKQSLNILDQFNLL